MKKCKCCQSEIDAKAKICPICKKKQNKNGMWILIGILAIIFIPYFVGKNAEEKSKKEYLQNETADYNGVYYSILKVDKTQGNNDYIKPKDGYEYVKVTLRIENKSNKKISYNALDWRMVNSDGVEDSWGTYTADEDTKLSSGNLDAGGKVEGVLIWEQSIGDNNLKLRYYDSIFKEQYTFQFKLD